MTFLLRTTATCCPLTLRAPAARRPATAVRTATSRCPSTFRSLTMCRSPTSPAPPRPPPACWRHGATPPKPATRCPASPCWAPPPATPKHSAENLDEDLRQVLRRPGCKDEEICFILDESDVMDSGFLERMKALLANGEVPGLFEGDEHTTLMTQCKEGAQRQGLMLDTSEEMYKCNAMITKRGSHTMAITPRRFLGSSSTSWRSTMRGGAGWRRSSCTSTSG